MSCRIFEHLVSENNINELSEDDIKFVQAAIQGEVFVCSPPLLRTAAMEMCEEPNHFRTHV